MIDYRANVAALEDFRQSLANESISQPQIAKIRDDQLKDVNMAPDMALLGAMIDHLIWHAASDGAELLLVERAAELWKLGLVLYKKMGEIRTGLEGALSDPQNPDAVQTFDEAILKVNEFELAIAGKEVEIAILRDDIYAAAHPPSHPRQQNESFDRWKWSDILLARRTDAFARATWKRATNGAGKAFAFGVMSNYGANVCGSAYLGQVVGGPRRAHRHRDRLARNAVGSWFALSYPNSISLTSIADRIRYGLFTPTLPSTVEQLITDALAGSYDPGRTPPISDLQLGFKRLLRHLEALDTFVIPEIPALPLEPFLTKIYASTANPSNSIMASGLKMEISDSSGSGSGSGVTPQNLPTSSSVGEQDSRRSSKLDCGAFFMALFKFIAVTGIAGGPCLEDWFSGRTCKLWEGMKDDFAEWWRTMFSGQEPLSEGEPVRDASRLTAASGSEEVTTLIHSLYDAQTHFWETLNSAYDYLSINGLIYPDALINGKKYSQFIRIPTPKAGGWPHLPMADSAERAYQYPSTLIEQPAVMTMPYPSGAAPGVFLTGTGSVVAASQVSTSVWMQTVSNQLDATNYDLDADRGHLHPCWTTGGSINDDPIDVVVLDYSDT
jgi:hypothetical protein